MTSNSTLLAVLSFSGLCACGAGSMTNDAGTTADGGVPHKRVFVTSGLFNADLKSAGNRASGLAGADALCTLAGTGGGLSGNFVAWLSNDTVNAIDRVRDVGPWYLVGVDDASGKAFNNRANLASTPLVPINVDEQGRRLAGSCAWTGTRVGGTTSKTSSGFALTCRGFELAAGNTYTGTDFGNVGDTSSTTYWTEAINSSGCLFECNRSNHLICLEQ